MRLDRFVSQATGLSRSQVKLLIRKGRIRIDGHAVKSGATPVPDGAVVTRGSEALSLPQALYLMMYKPRGLLSATQDAEQATVLSLLPDELASRVHLVGRLDKDTSGLLLLTDDGDWSHRITSPRRHCPKTYLAQLAAPLVNDAEARLAEGLMLRGETKPTLPAALARLAPDRVRITLGEGRYHQVRRMFGALDNRVTTLHRERIGGLELDPTMEPGTWRRLREEECLRVFESAQPAPDAPMSD